MTTISIKGLRSGQLNKEVSINGIVTKVSNVKPMISNAAYFCDYCEHITHVQQTDDIVIKPISCENETCDRKDRLRLLKDKSTWIDIQDIVIAEPSECKYDIDEAKSVLSVRLEGDLVDTVKPEDSVAITGILDTSFSSRSKSNISEFLLHAKLIEPIEKEALSSSGTSKAQRDQIKIMLDIIRKVGVKHPGGNAPLEEIYAEAADKKMSKEQAEQLIAKIRRSGDLLKPNRDHVRLV